MSLILDALKKLDREKSSRRSGTANIAIEILRPDLPRPGKRNLLYFAAVSLTAVATVAITYGVMGGFGFLSKSSPPALVNPPASTQQVAPPPLEPGSLMKPSPPAPVSPPALTQQVAPAPPLTPEPVRDARDEISRVPPKIQNQAESKPPAISLGEKKTRQNVISQEADVAPGTIKLSGILWHEEPSERRAAVNGTVITEGSVIEGVKVVEIFPTRVRFSYNGRPFEISMSE
jgi:general secretion pathway protein B